MFTEFERRLQQAPRPTLRLQISSGRTLPVILVQGRLGVKRINLRRTAVHKQVNHSLRPGRKHGLLRGQWSPRRFRPRSTLRSQQACQPQGPQPRAESLQQIAP